MILVYNMGCTKSKIHDTDGASAQSNYIYLLEQEVDDKDREIKQLSEELENTNISTRITITMLRKKLLNMDMDTQ